MERKTFSSERTKVLENYIHISKCIIQEVYRLFNPKDIRLVWSGHKDSTLVLWIWKSVCEERGFIMPKAVTLDEGDPFEEVEKFLEEISAAWGITLDTACNKDVLEACRYAIGGEVSVASLNERNRAEIERIGFGELAAFPFEAESFVGNHLMKSVALNQYIEAENVKVIVQGLRWDEQPARSDDLYIEDMAEQPMQPAHTRARPILHIDERSLWDIYSHYQIPAVSLYERGYRSLGVSSTTSKSWDIPAWEQDLDNTAERAGRRQDKEEAMRRLRMLGYM
jgi:phosphoadenosine phosphosulfate reductase